MDPKNHTPDFQPVKARKATGKAPVLVEIICERVHCVMYDYAIHTVDMVVEPFKEQVDVQTIIRHGDKKDSEKFLQLCREAGRLLSVPTILVNGHVLFDTIPLPDELEAAIQSHIKKPQGRK
ncbi:MAG: hypothetical protein MI747_09740 [Desulfobacterales bacterium]|nr:hypothetical protein [Desulfobacterales bacterium]